MYLCAIIFYSDHLEKGKEFFTDIYNLYGKKQSMER